MSQTPTKDELDAQLDAYNAKVRCVFFFDSRKKVLVLALDSWLIGLNSSFPRNYNILGSAGEGEYFN